MADLTITKSEPLSIISSPPQTKPYDPANRGVKAKGEPTPLPDTYMGTITKDFAAMPESVYHAVRHPIDTISGLAESAYNLPGDVLYDIGHGNWGKLAARATELAIPALSTRRGASAGMGAANAAFGTTSLRRLGLDFPVWKPFAGGAAGATLARAIPGMDPELGAAIGAATPIIKGAVEGFNNPPPIVLPIPRIEYTGPNYLGMGPVGVTYPPVVTPPGEMPPMGGKPFRPNPSITRQTRFGGITKPDYSPARPTPRGTFIPPVEAETPYPAGKGTGTKYGGPATTDYSPARPTPRGTFEPPIQPIEAEPVAPEPYKPNPNIKRQLKFGGTTGEAGMPQATGGKVTRIKPITVQPEQAPPLPVATPAPTPIQPPGSITVPPINEASPRYGEIGSTGGTMQAGMAFTKDGEIANYLKSQNVSPEMWSKLSLDEKNAHISAAGAAAGKKFKPLGKGGVLGRSAEAGSKDIENLLNDVWEK